jgi:hypothetical protein
MKTKDRSDWTITSFASHEDAEHDDILERLAMTGEERLRLTESLRAIYYGYAENGIEPRLERTLEVLAFP